MICIFCYHLYLTHDRYLIIFSELIHVNLFSCIYICIIHSGRYMPVNHNYFYHYWVVLKLEAIVEIIKNNFYFLFFLWHYLKFR